MKWATRSYAYLDRVSSPWLIARFIDAEATFVFVPWEPDAAIPADAIPFALPGATLGEHDENGTTFQKILAAYELTDAVLHHLGRIIERAVAYTVRRYRPESADPDGQLAAALVTLSEGMLLVEHDDHLVLERSFPLYDALYRSLRARAIMAERGEAIPPSGGRGPGVRTEYLRALLRDG
jgi:hypothetical protein